MSMEYRSSLSYMSQIMASDLPWSPSSHQFGKGCIVVSISEIQRLGHVALSVFFCLVPVLLAIPLHSALSQAEVKAGCVQLTFHALGGPTNALINYPLDIISLCYVLWIPRFTGTVQRHSENSKCCICL